MNPEEYQRRLEELADKLMRDQNYDRDYAFYEARKQLEAEKVKEEVEDRGFSITKMSKAAWGLPSYLVYNENFDIPWIFRRHTSRLPHFVPLSFSWHFRVAGKSGDIQVYETGMNGKGLSQRLPKEGDFLYQGDPVHVDEQMVRIASDEEFSLDEDEELAYQTLLEHCIRQDFGLGTAPELEMDNAGIEL